MTSMPSSNIIKISPSTQLSQGSNSPPVAAKAHETTFSTSRGPKTFRKTLHMPNNFRVSQVNPSNLRVLAFRRKAAPSRNRQKTIAEALLKALSHKMMPSLPAAATAPWWKLGPSTSSPVRRLEAHLSCYQKSSRNTSRSPTAPQTRKYQTFKYNL